MASAPTSLPLALQAPDHILIHRAIAGQEMAFSQLMSRYDRLVTSMLRRYLSLEEDIQEARQDTFLRAYRFLANFRGEARFSTWLAKIAITTALDRLRARRLETISLDEQLTPVLAMHAGMPEAPAQLEARDRQSMIFKALTFLSAEDAQVLSLFYLHEQSLDEICQVTGMTLTNAKSRLSRARQRLRAVMDTHFSSDLLN